MTSPDPQPAIDLHKLEKIQRGVQYAATVALIVTIGLVVFASWKLAGVYRTLNDAQAQLKDTDEDLRKKRVEVDTLDARIKELVERERSLNEALRAVETVAVTPPGPLTVPGPIVTRKLPPRVYLQIFNDAQRARARELQKALEARGFVVPGIENVSGKARPQAVSDVRFYGGAEDSSDVRAIQQAARDLNISLKEIPLKRSAAVRPRHYEIWLGNDVTAR